MPSRSGLVELNVKLTIPAPGRMPTALEQVPGVVRVTRTFPDEQDEELRALFVLRVEATRADDVLRALRRDPAVAYAEACAQRRPLSTGRR
jgi:hypothetical protein